MVGDELCAHIAKHLVGNTDVGPDELEDRLIELALLIELENRNLEPFLVYVLRLKRRHATPHVEVMDNAQGIANDAPTMEDRGRDGDVDQVTTRDPRVVRDDCVTRLQRLRRMQFDEVAHHLRHDAKKPGGRYGGVR